MYYAKMYYTINWNSRISVPPLSAGFNPTFGPSWVNLYGSPQNSTLGDVHQVIYTQQTSIKKGSILLSIWKQDGDEYLLFASFSKFSLAQRLKKMVRVLLALSKNIYKKNLLYHPKSPRTNSCVVLRQNNIGYFQLLTVCMLS